MYFMTLRFLFKIFKIFKIKGFTNSFILRWNFNRKPISQVINKRSQGFLYQEPDQYHDYTAHEDNQDHDHEHYQD